MNKIIMILITTICSTLAAQAQEAEYLMEIGGSIGLSSYLGDASSNPFSHPGPMATILHRRNFNPRMVLKSSLGMGHVSGSSKGTFIPTDAYSPTTTGGTLTQIDFGRNLLNLGTQFEFNFWGYGTGEGYKGHSRITPYATVGLGITLITGGHAKATAGLSAPVGAGVKYKIKPRLNLGLEWTVHFTTSDRLDINGNYKQLNMPYGIKSKGIKNKDCFSHCMVYISYDFCEKLRKCNND